MIISGDRVRLRDVCASDLEDYKRWFTPGKPWQEWDAPWENTEENLARFCVQLLKRLQEPPPDPRTRLEIETAEGRHLGWVNSYSADQHTHGRECGIDIAEEDAWGQGLGREALTLWVGYLFGAHGLSRVGLGTWSGNERMIRLAARIGMREEARFADARQFAGHIYDGVRWGVTREEWERYEAPRSDGLRRHTPVDWEMTVELTRQLFQHHRSLQRGPAFTISDARTTVQDWLAPRNSIIFLWQEAGRVVALAHARYTGIYYFEELVVAEDCRGKGIGGRFMKAIENQLRTEGQQDVFLSMVWPGNPAAIDFHRGLGYDLINTIELRKGLASDRRGREVEFLGRQFHLGKSVPFGPTGQGEYPQPLTNLQPLHYNSANYDIVRSRSGSGGMPDGWLGPALHRIGSSISCGSPLEMDGQREAV